MPRMTDTESLPQNGTRNQRRLAPLQEESAVDRIFRRVRVAAGAGLVGAVLGGVVGASPIAVGAIAATSEEIGLVLGLAVGAVLAFYKG